MFSFYFQKLMETTFLCYVKIVFFFIFYFVFKICFDIPMVEECYKILKIVFIFKNRKIFLNHMVK